MSVASANRSAAFIPTPHKFRLLLVVYAKTDTRLFYFQAWQAASAYP